MFFFFLSFKKYYQYIFYLSQSLLLIYYISLNSFNWFKLYCLFPNIKIDYIHLYPNLSMRFCAQTMNLYNFVNKAYFR